MKKIFLTPKELAKLLQVKTHTIYRLCRKRKIPFIKIGKLYRIPYDFILKGGDNK